MDNVGSANGCVKVLWWPNRTHRTSGIMQTGFSYHGFQSIQPSETETCDEDFVKTCKKNIKYERS